MLHRYLGCPKVCKGGVGVVMEYTSETFCLELHEILEEMFLVSLSKRSEFETLFLLI